MGSSIRIVLYFSLFLIASESHAVLESFTDSGSNALSFPYSGSSLTLCSSPFSGWFCPSSLVTLSADTISSSMNPAGTVTFGIGNFRTFYLSSNAVSKTTGAESGHGPLMGLLKDRIKSGDLFLKSAPNTKENVGN